MTDAVDGRKIDDGTLHRKRSDRVEIYAVVLHDKRLSPGAFRLYCHLHWLYGIHDDVFDGRAGFATEFGVSEQTISAWIREIEAAGWLVVVEQFNFLTGAFMHNHYHVFEDERASAEFSLLYACEPGEHIRPLPEPIVRTSRKGVGGRKKASDTVSTQVYTPVSTQVDAKELYISLSSVSKEQDKDQENELEKEKDSTPEKMALALSISNSWQPFLAAVVKALKFGDEGYGRATKTAQMLLGTIKAKDSHGRDNGEWFANRVKRPATALEIDAFGTWLGYEYDGPPMRAAEVIVDWFGRFRIDPDYALMVQRAEMNAGLVIEEELPDEPHEVNPEGQRLVRETLERVAAALDGKR